MTRVNRRKVKMHRILTGVAFVFAGLFVSGGWLGVLLAIGCIVAGGFFIKNTEESAIAAYCAREGFEYRSRR